MKRCVQTIEEITYVLDADEVKQALVEYVESRGAVLHTDSTMKAYENGGAIGSVSFTTRYPTERPEELTASEKERR